MREVLLQLKIILMSASGRVKVKNLYSNAS
jgi:hypothetical protein